MCVCVRVRGACVRVRAPAETGERQVLPLSGRCSSLLALAFSLAHARAPSNTRCVHAQTHTSLMRLCVSARPLAAKPAVGGRRRVAANAVRKKEEERRIWRRRFLLFAVTRRPPLALRPLRHGPCPGEGMCAGEHTAMPSKCAYTPGWACWGAREPASKARTTPDPLSTSQPLPLSFTGGQDRRRRARTAVRIHGRGRRCRCPDIAAARP